tara:strand:- start:82957 stop:83271 length:315 start_codon:yes stop_codon:yes gene_type:complete
VRTGEGKIRLFVAIDRTSKFSCVERHERAGKMVVAQFLRNLIAVVPYKIHTVLTDNGIQFTNRKQVERMNRTIKAATLKRYHYETHSHLETHVTDFIAADNDAR